MELTKEVAKELYDGKTEIIISAEYETIGKMRLLIMKILFQ